MCGGSAEKAKMPESAKVQAAFSEYLNDTANRREFKQNEAALKKREARDNTGYFEGRSSADQAAAGKGALLKSAGQHKVNEAAGERIAQVDVQQDLQSETVATAMMDEGRSNRQNRMLGGLSRTTQGLEAASSRGMSSAIATADAKTTLNKAKGQAIGALIGTGAQMYGMEQGYQAAKLNSKGDLTRKDYFSPLNPFAETGGSGNSGYSGSSLGYQERPEQVAGSNPFATLPAP